MKLITSKLLLLLLLVSVIWSVRVSHVKADGTIYIRADGSIDPVTANITSSDNVTYIFTDNNHDSIIVERENILVDGAAYTLQGKGSGAGFDLSNIDNVTIQDTTIRNFYFGIYLEESSHNTIVGNTFTNNSEAISLFLNCDNNTIQGNTITHGYTGIQTAYSCYNTIADNLIVENEGRAVHLDDASNYNHLLRNNITDGGTGVYLDHASAHNILRNNSIAGNWYNFGVHIYALEYIIQDIDPSNTVDGKPIYYLVNRSDEPVPSDAGYVALVNCTNMTVEGLELRNNLEGLLLAGTQNSTIQNNTVASNWYDVKFVHSSNNLLYHNNFMNYGNPYFSGGSGNMWDGGYPSGGNYWSDYDGLDLYNGPYQNETGSDGVGDSPFVLGNGNKDNYPLMKSYPWASHDIGVTAVITSKTVVGQGYGLQINMTMFNYGIFTENFNVTANANMTIIDTYENIALTSRNSATLTFTWNTTGYTKGNYSISANVTMLPGETDTADNTDEDNWVFVTIPGDVDGDRDVDIYDIVAMADAYGSKEGDAGYNPKYDIDGDGDIDIFDIVAAAGNYGESW